MRNNVASHQIQDTGSAQTCPRESLHRHIIRPSRVCKHPPGNWSAGENRKRQHKHTDAYRVVNAVHNCGYTGCKILPFHVPISSGSGTSKAIHGEKIAWIPPARNP